MELTREQAIKEYREHWQWQAENPMKPKEEYPKIKESPTPIIKLCFLCHYTNFTCSKCPVEWPKTCEPPWSAESVPCMASYYYEWERAKKPEERSRLAALIRDLPEKAEKKETPAPRFAVGDKVVPVSKSIGEFAGDLDSEPNWIDSKKRGYFYVTQSFQHCGKQAYGCHCNDIRKCGNHFLESDLTPYVEPPKTKFKVGDIVTGNSSNRYGITNDEMTKGKVVKVRDNGLIDVKVLKHKKPIYNDGHIYDSLEDKFFDLIVDEPKEPTPEPKPSFKVGDRVRVKPLKEINTLRQEFILLGGYDDSRNVCAEKTFTIESISQHGKYTGYKLNEECHTWDERLLELAPPINHAPFNYELTESTIFKFKGNKTTCIIEIDGRKFKGVAHCDPADEWNEKTGRDWAELRAQRKMLDACEKELRG